MIRRFTLLLLPFLFLTGCVFSPRVSLFGGEPAAAERKLMGDGEPKILLLHVHGVITDSASAGLLGLSRQASTLEQVDAALRRARDDRQVKALILHINSPGGGVTASDEIQYRLLQFRRERAIPVIAVLGDVATSGGYYIATAADTILIQPTGITGSIGVLLVKFNIAELLDKVGVRDETFTAGRLKTMISPFRPSTQEEERLVQDIIDGMHARFVGIVRASRPTIPASRLPNVTDGRILSADQAVAAGLADRFGRLDDAIALARTRLQAPDAQVVRYDDLGQASGSVYSSGASLPGALGAGTSLFQGHQFMYLWPGAMRLNSGDAAAVVGRALAPDL